MHVKKDILANVQNTMKLYEYSYFHEYILFNHPKCLFRITCADNLEQLA